MLEGKRVLAVVPARSGSKGVPHKNMRAIRGVSLIGRAGMTLSELTFIDSKIISTDSAEYAREGRKFGLDAPFLRPDRLSSDEAGALETMQHALLTSERHYATRFDILLIVEPTSPLRTPGDVELAARRLIETGADSVVTVSVLSSKCHPLKIFSIEEGRLRFYVAEGRSIKARQSLLDKYFWRNGLCYAITRTCLLDKGSIITDNTVPLIIDRPVVNIDDPLDVAWAEFLLSGAA